MTDNITFFVNDETIDLDKYGSLEEFQAAIPEISYAGINDTTLCSTHEDIWNLFQEWNKYDDYEQDIIYNYCCLENIELDEPLYFDRALDMYFGQFLSVHEAGLAYFRSYMDEVSKNSLAYEFLINHTEQICEEFLEHNNNYYYFL